MLDIPRASFGLIRKKVIAFFCTPFFVGRATRENGETHLNIYFYFFSCARPKRHRWPCFLCSAFCFLFSVFGVRARWWENSCVHGERYFIGRGDKWGVN